MYFQNPFEQEFIGFMITQDRSLPFKVAANRNRSTVMNAYGTPPYDLTGNNSLTFNFSTNYGQIYRAFTVTLTSGSGRTVFNVVDELNADATFASLFTASVVGKQTQTQRVQVKYRLGDPESFRCYIDNTSAETILLFNLHAGVAEIPSYFERHTVANYVGGSIVNGVYTPPVFSDSVGLLVKLTQPTYNAVITNAGLSTTARADYLLLGGKSNSFTFKKLTIDGSNRITEIIEYYAGASAGDLAKKTTYTYVSANTNPSTIVEVPYTLASGDIITP